MQSLSQELNHQTCRVSPDAFERGMARFGLRHANDTERVAGLEVGERLTGNALISAEQLERVDRLTGMTCWVTGEPVDGIYITVPVTSAGRSAIEDGSFTPGKIDKTHIAVAGDNIAALYIGIYAGETKEARRNVVQASAVLRVELFSAIPCFARAATEDGARSMSALGFRPAGKGLPELFVSDPIKAEGEVV